MNTARKNRLARSYLSDYRFPSNIAVEIVDGDSAPDFAGETWHYETRTGKRIYHPSAYSAKGWSSMRYVPSTHRIVVGRGWFVGKVY